MVLKYSRPKRSKTKTKIKTSALKTKTKTKTLAHETKTKTCQIYIYIYIYIYKATITSAVCCPKSKYTVCLKVINFSNYLLQIALKCLYISPKSVCRGAHNTPPDPMPVSLQTSQFPLNVMGVE